MHDPSLHLFIDDHHIRNAYSLKRVFFPLEQDHQPILTDTIGRSVAWGCAMLDQEKYRLWYHSTADDPTNVADHQLSMVGYAESNDALNWHRPNLGLIDWQGSKNNNLCFDGSGPSKQFNGFVTNLDSVSIIRDDSAPPEKRYAMINHWESIHCWDNEIKHLNRPKELIDKYWAHRAKYLTTSPDGIHWNPEITRIKNVEGGDYCAVLRDERNQQYWFADRPAVALGIGYFRLAGLSISRDLYHWPDHLEQILWPGEFEDFGHRYQHHGWTPFNYGDQDLAVLELSIVGRPVMGILCSHRDGQRWRICGYDVPLLKAGPTGELDDQIAAVTRNAPFVIGDKLRFIYNGRGGINAQRPVRIGAMYAAHLRLDGFAAMVVDDDAVQRHGHPAVLQTQPLRVTQQYLDLNIVGHQQTARVALLDDSMSAIPGYDVTDCLPIEEDATRAIVRWKNRPDLKPLRGQDVHVQIRLHSGRVYAIRI